MRTVIKGLLMAAVCLMIMVNIASAEMPDPAMEVEEYLAGEDWQAVRESIPPQAAEKMAEQGISSVSYGVYPGFCRHYDDGGTTDDRGDL